jgi:uncharacterized protein YjeT (DUF2065 family)
LAAAAMTDFLTACALVLVIEGMVWALFPDRMKSMALRLGELPPMTLRGVALLMATIGVALIWLIRG